MARGRMISVTLGRSKKYNQLPDHFTKLVYIHTLTAADEQGRIEADAIAVYGDHFVVDPEASLERIEAALFELHRVGLIQLYEVDGKRYAQFVDFEKHNTIRRDKDGAPTREGRSRIPPPPDDCAATAQTPRSSSAETDPQVEVQDQVEDQVQTSPPTPPTPAPPAQGQAEEDLDRVKRVPPRGSDKIQALRQRNPTVWEELGKASSDRGWKPQQFRAIALSVYELAHEHGEAATRQAVRDMVMAGDRVHSPAGWLKHRLDNRRDEPERDYSQPVTGADLLDDGPIEGSWKN